MPGTICVCSQICCCANDSGALSPWVRGVIAFVTANLAIDGALGSLTCTVLPILGELPRATSNCKLALLQSIANSHAKSSLGSKACVPVETRRIPYFWTFQDLGQLGVRGLVKITPRRQSAPVRQKTVDDPLLLRGKAHGFQHVNALPPATCKRMTKYRAE